MTTRYSRSSQQPVIHTPPGRYTDAKACCLAAFAAFVADALLFQLETDDQLGTYDEPYWHMHGFIVRCSPNITWLHTTAHGQRVYWSGYA